jgi:ketosteroid isomerase-like protein
VAYAEAARLLPPSAELMEGREAIEAFWKAGLEVGISDVELETLEFHRQNGLAYEIGRYALRLQPAEDGAIVERGKYVLVHERQRDGSWRWAVEMFNPDVPPATMDGHAEEGRR